MNVILLQDVENLGLRGDVVSVARGYARNFLVPRKLAEVATTAKVEELRKRDSRRTLQEARSSEQAETIAETLRKTVLRFEMKAGPRMTMNSEGKMHPTSGNSILIGAWAACSSARWRRSMRSCSDCT